MIYRYICEDQIIVLRAHEDKFRSSLPDKSPSKVLHVCRQIRYEVLPIFFQHTVFELQPKAFDLSIVPIARMDPTTRNAIRNIRLDVKGKPRRPIQLDPNISSRDRVYGVRVPRLEHILTQYRSEVFKYEKVDGAWTRS